MKNYKLSAGRVQSVTLRMIYDREREIDEFIPEEYWTIDAYLNVPAQKKPVQFSYKGDIKTKKEADEIAKAVTNGSFVVSDIKNTTRTKKAPFHNQYTPADSCQPYKLCYFKNYESCSAVIRRC